MHQHLHPHDHHLHDHDHASERHHHDHHHDDERRFLARIPPRWLALAAALLFGYLSFYTVRETEFALVTQFGRPLYAISDAGLHMKWFFQSVTRFDRRLNLYNPRPSEFLTRDKKNLVIESYVAWRIEDPRKFVETVGSMGAAELRLHDIVWSGLSVAVGSQDLETVINVNASQRTFQGALDRLVEATDANALRQYGIRVVDVRVKRLNLPEQNRQSVFARMRAERERIARQYRAEGEEQALRIRAEADRQKEEILSAAYKEAEKIKGEGDAESARVHGAAYSKNPRLYKLLRTLEAYKKVFDEKTTAIISADSELMRVLMRGENGVK
jgi:membrane protease subunit HflC